MIEDIVALKSRLAETVRFLEAESAKAHESAAQELLRFETEVTEMREFLGNTRTELAGRPEAVSRIEDSLKKVVPGEALYLVAFRFDRLQSVAQRYGPAVADELIFRIIKERLQPVAPGDTAYRWTLSSLVAVFRRLRSLAALRTEVAKLNSAPLVHRIALGNRTAVMTVTPSHLVAEGVSESPGQLIEQVDLFTGACA
jgi:GGDEF domain-containing protein